MSGARKMMTKRDAIEYINKVRDTFRDKKKFGKFINTVKDYKHHRINVSVLIERMEEILKDQKDLILGFNRFLPKGYEILFIPEGEMQFENAVEYVNKIKCRFEDTDHVFKSFLIILTNYKNGTVPVDDTYYEAAKLFKDHPDILRDFTKFLPPLP